MSRDTAEHQSYISVTLRHLYIENRPDSVLKISAWAQEQFQESMSVNTAQVSPGQSRLENITNSTKKTQESSISQEWDNNPKSGLKSHTEKNKL